MSCLFFLIRVCRASFCCLASPIQFLRHFYSAKGICRAAPSNGPLSNQSPRALASWHLAAVRERELLRYNAQAALGLYLRGSLAS